MEWKRAGTKELFDTVTSYVLYGLPDEVGGEEIKIFFNQNTGYCCVEDSMEREARLNKKGRLETFVCCGDCGEVGFLSELPDFDIEKRLCKECFILDLWEGKIDEKI
jgi:hypothetical protein